MIGLIITGHAHFASGLTSALKLIYGDGIKNIETVDFPDNESTDDLERHLNQAFDNLKECDGILVCSDITGGSPFKTAVQLGLPKGNVEIVSGTNLPMLVEINILREAETDVKAFALNAIDVAKRMVQLFEMVKVEDEPIDEDGI